ncbi:maleylpyruvate isomerase family mycothiol-dependent enzyme [Pseudonocardia acaciae]|uniref:maleylpyruvate isomerase family mycothiol-dependent enzyme n=1 Tax=Pseudonocardia acaciae TaxID=551276 RepID=UPI00056568B7|nr:maleylpyruvate isomerase family mycothiol-dependent enzyme [Pseudonocardia acaciae]
MRPDEHLGWLAAERAAFARVLRDGDLAAPVPGCPSWHLAELTAHLGAVHRWARQVVETGATASNDHPAPAGRTALADWFDEGGAALERTLRGIEPDTPCWTIAPPAVAAFWMRRQAHETSLHRWDAQSSQGTPDPIDPALAADGVAEVAEAMFPRQVRLGRQPPLTRSLRVEVPDAGAYTVAGDGTAAPGPDSQPADVTVTGPAEALLLLLWKRTTLDDPRISVTGSPAAAHAVLGARITP